MTIIYSKETLIERLKEIRQIGWIKNRRHGNVGGVGNTLEDLLGIEENNLPIPNAAEWELKCQRLNTTSLTTLFHMEPSPRALKFVPNVLLPLYGWPHKKAGEKYSDSEMSFRQTISALSRSDRGFTVIINKQEQKVLISFNSKEVSERHAEWLEGVDTKTGLCELEPQPYWGFKDLYHKAGTKLHNCFFVGANVKKEKGVEYFKYDKIMMLTGFSLNSFIDALESGDILVDFDARTGHNHGTKFRFRKNKLHEFYDHMTEI